VQIARLAVAACALLVLVGCGIGHSSQVARPTQSATPTAAAAERSDYQVSDGVHKSIENGVALTVSPPKSFTPSDTASTSASRAVAFDVAIDNSGTVGFRPASLAFTATIDGRATEQVIDSTQGYNGPSGTTEEVAPDTSLRIAVAFAASKEACRMIITVRSDAASALPVLLYDGTV
jgi:hypothetical protein